MKLNNIICELDKKGLIVLAGRPAVGKTTLALYLANSISKETDGKILYFSLDESKEKLGIRCTGNNIKILDKSNVDVDYLKNECEKNKNDLKLVIIDYFQLINTSITNTEKTIDELNLISNQYNIPLIITSQLSKISKNKRPVLKDFSIKYLVEKAEKVICLYGINEINKINTIYLSYIKGGDNIDTMTVMFDYQLCEFNIVDLKINAKRLSKINH